MKTLKTFQNRHWHPKEIKSRVMKSRIRFAPKDAAFQRLCWIRPISNTLLFIFLLLRRRREIFKLLFNNSPTIKKSLFYFNWNSMFDTKPFKSDSYPGHVRKLAWTSYLELKIFSTSYFRKKRKFLIRISFITVHYCSLLFQE